MSFSSEIKEEILKKFNLKKSSACCIKAERFGEYLTSVHKKQDLEKNYKDFFNVSSLNECCIKSIFKGAFLSSGCITSPQNNYHFEITFKNKSCAEFLLNLLALLEFTPKLIKRKNSSHYVLYIKEAEQISTLLSLMEVTSALLKFENIRVEKNVKNNINRNINCETANLSKTIEASVKQLEAIKKLKKEGKYIRLNEKLKIVAECRQKYPNESIEFLSKIISKQEPISKSGVKHRLDKIVSISLDNK